VSALASRVARLFVEHAAGEPVPAASPRREPWVAAVLAPSEHCDAAAAGVALALARAHGAPCAIAAVAGRCGGWGMGAPTAPATRCAAARAGAHAIGGSASGRLVRLDAPLGAEDPSGLAAAASALLGRAVAASGVPGALAVPFARDAGLDRVLGWHHAIVVVHHGRILDALVQPVLESVAALGRPVARMEPPARVPATAAMLGLRMPADAARAVAELGA